MTRFDCLLWSLLWSAKGGIVLARRGESIFKRKDGRWEARYPCGIDAQGRKKYRSVYARTYSEVKEHRRLAMQTAAGPPKNNTCLAAVLKMWLENKRINLKDQSFNGYERCIQNHILPMLGDIPVYRINDALIDAFLQKKLRSGRLDGNGGLSQNYVRTIAIVLQSALNYAFQMKMGLPQPIKLQKPRLERKQIKVLKLHEQILLENDLKQNMDYGNLAIYLGLHTGLRIGELCALRWENIDLTENQIYVCATVIHDSAGACIIGTPKSDSSNRIVPITQSLARLLKDRKNGNKTGFVFRAPQKGDFLNPRTLQYRFKSILKKCGLPDIPFHALRHTFATRWIECGMDMKSLSEVLGHSNVSITLNTYVHSSDDLKRSSIEAIEKITGQKSGQ